MALLFEDLSYKLRGLFFEVYNELVPGFKEEVYVRALLKLLDDYKIPYEKERIFNINYRGTKLGMTKIDLLVNGKIIVEVKATDINHNVFEKQLLSYLKSSGLSLGFLVNFGMNKLYIKRFVNTEQGSRGF